MTGIDEQPIAIRDGRGPRVHHVIEIRGVYDGWSVAAMDDGTLINRWADPADPTTSREGYEGRFEATQKYIDGLLADRAAMKEAA